MTTDYDGVDYSLWPMFEGVDEFILKDIILLHIFGSAGQSAIFVTKDDQVYAVGGNVVGYLGIGDIDRVETPVKLDILCGKFVMGFASGSTHSVAYTKEGELYSWGDNTLGKLGNGTIIYSDSPGRVLLPQGVKVIQAACSDRYTAAITSELKVLHWGDIEWNSGASQTLPIYLEFPGRVEICSLCCGALHAAALSLDGQVYTWGCGDMGQLGQGRPTPIETRPHSVEGQLTGLFVQQIACTMVSTVALTDDGRVYAWGHNSGGVLGLSLDIETVPCPQQVQIDDRIKSVAAANMGSVITGVSENRVYRWGLEVVFNYGCNGRYPYEVQVSHLLNAYGGSPTPRWDRSLELNNNARKSNVSEIDDKRLSLEEEIGVTRDIGSTLFNNKEYSDLVLRLSDGVIFVHKLILRTFCEHFKSMLDGSWSENSKEEIDLTKYNPQAYRAFVKYIYTGKLDNSLTGMQLIELSDIAESYFEHDLKRMVISAFPSCLTINNAAELYCAAFSQSCEEIKELCCEFISTRMDEVVLTEGFDSLKGDLCKTLIKRAVQIKNNIPQSK